MTRLLPIFFLCVATTTMRAATITAASGSKSDVDIAYALTSDGDILDIPLDNEDWPSTLTVTKAIHIRGAGTNNTLIGSSAGLAVFDFDQRALLNKTVRLTDIQIKQGSSPSSAAWIWVQGCNTNNTYMVMSNCWFNGTTAPCPFVIGALGVQTRCRYNITNGIGLYVYHENWGGKSFSNGSFYQPVNWGSDEFWYLENSSIHRAGASYAFTDAYRGARYAVRHVVMTNCWLEAHGTESGFVRGTRAVESYFNTIIGDGATDYGHNLRSSTALIFSNTIANAGAAANFAHVTAYRKTVSTDPFYGATGSNPIDDNSATLFESGTATGGGTLSLTHSGKSWTTDQWVGYTLSRLSPLTTDKTLYTDFRHGFITANTANTITCAVNIGGAFPDISFANGDSYQIRKVTQIFDQPGMYDTIEIVYRKNSALTVSGKIASAALSSHGFSTGDVIIMGQLTINSSEVYTMAMVTNTGANTYEFYLNTANGTASANAEGWVYKIQTFSQGVDPCYEWGNTKEGGVDVDFSNASSPIISSGVHYFNNTVKPGYTPLAYPHPLLGVAAPPADLPAAPGVQRIGGISFKR